MRAPIHPYARGLLASTVHGAKRGARLDTIPGRPPPLDKVPVKQVADWQDQFLAYMREQRPETRNKLAKEKKLSKDLETELKQAIGDFQPQFKK